MALGINGVRTRIKDLVAALGAAAVGLVHDYVRLAESEAEIKAKFSSSNLLHVWMVSLSDAEPYTTMRKPANHELADYVFNLHGFRAVDDADGSEKTFAAEVETIIAAFRADKKLGNTVIEAGPAQWVEGGYKTFSGVLCHYARLSVRVREQVEP